MPNGLAAITKVLEGFDVCLGIWDYYGNLWVSSEELRAQGLHIFVLLQGRVFGV